MRRAINTQFRNYCAENGTKRELTLTIQLLTVWIDVITRLPVSESDVCCPQLIPHAL